MQTFRACYRSEIGSLEVVGNQQGILTITFVEDDFEADRNLPAGMTECLRQLGEYFKGKRQKFSVPLLVEGTDFQKAVWRQLQKIPFGQTASYGDVARAVGSPKAFRAVGNANNKNPIPASGAKSGCWTMKTLFKSRLQCQCRYCAGQKG